MSIDIRIERQPPLHALEIARNAPMWKIPKLLGNDFPRIDKHITAQGGNRIGAPYVRYMEIVGWAEGNVGDRHADFQYRKSVACQNLTAPAIT